jgi:hypothetical protein
MEKLTHTQSWIGVRKNIGAYNEHHYVQRVDENGKKTVLPGKQNVRNHSPSGLNWGYYGSGPCQLGIALVSDFFGGLYQDFKEKIIADLPDNWELSRSEVADTLTALVSESKVEMFTEQLDRRCSETLNKRAASRN